MVATISNIDKEEYIDKRLNVDIIKNILSAHKGDTVPFSSCDWIVLQEDMLSIRLISKYLIAPLFFRVPHSRTIAEMEVNIIAQLRNLYSAYDVKTSDKNIQLDFLKFNDKETLLLCSQDVSWHLNQFAGTFLGYISLPSISDINVLYRQPLPASTTYEDTAFNSLTLRPNEAEDFNTFLAEDSTELNSYWIVTKDAAGHAHLAYINPEGERHFQHLGIHQNHTIMRGFRPVITLSKTIATGILKVLETEEKEQ